MGLGLAATHHHRSIERRQFGLGFLMCLRAALCELDDSHELTFGSPPNQLPNATQAGDAADYSKGPAEEASARTSDAGGSWFCLLLAV